MLKLEGWVHGGSRGPRVHRRVVAALLVIGVVACGSDPAGPPEPGSIQVTAATAGFLKPAGYQLLVNGASEGAIGAGEEMTVSGLEPGDYQVGLGEVPANCSVEGADVTVESGETAAVLLTVECAFADPVEYKIQFNRERPDLDTGEITLCTFGICPSQEDWDLYVQNNIQSTPNSVIRQNQTAGVEIAHLAGVTLDGLTEADVEAAQFSTALDDAPFDAGRVILIRSDLGSVFALGNPVEDEHRLTFDAALISEP